MSGNKAVLFDMDGVIFDSERAVLAVWREIAGEWSLPGIGEVFIRCVGTNKRRTEEIFLAAYPALDFHAFDDEVRRRFLARYDRGRLPVKPGAEQILRALREKGVPLALASSTESGVVRRELEEAGLLRYFDAVIGGDQVHVSKPTLDTPPEGCFVIEDSFNGIRAARAAGMHPVIVPDLLPPDGEMEKLAEVILPDLAAAETYIIGRVTGDA